MEAKQIKSPVKCRALEGGFGWLEAFCSPPLGSSIFCLPLFCSGDSKEEVCFGFCKQYR